MCVISIHLGIIKIISKVDITYVSIKHINSYDVFINL